MKRINRFIIFAIVIIAVLFSFCGCESAGFKQDDFEIKLISVEVDGNKVTVQTEFKNKSYRNGLVFSGDPLIEIYCNDENGESQWVYSSIGRNYWIICKQKRTKTDVFELEEGIYTIQAYVSLSCNNGKDLLSYSTETVTIEIKNL